MLVPTVVGFHSFEIPNAGDETCALSMKQMTHSGRVAALGTGGPKRKVTHLRQTDFQGGTYRIRESGVYVLTEDIYFGPRPDNDYWPEPEDANYPASQFYLGFFAGITVEADNVEIDLNGHTLAQNKEFYLLQRFWNAIELANRVFVDNEGVASLNFQEGDKEQFQTGRVPVTRGASNVYIHDGTLGLSSHSGIHGNNASKVHIEKVSIRDWEVSGIHLNGCRKCRVTRCTVGPTSWQVPARATFANARFLELYTSRLIPLGFRQEGVLDLLNATITFADRSPETVEAVFKRLGRAVKLFQDQYMDRLDKPSLSAEDVALLHDATKLFAPRVPVPDGSVIYGIIFNHLGVPGDDENHYGAGEEAAEIVIERTVIQNLTIKPGEVAAILHSDGKFAQGPIRDLFRVLEVVDNRLRTLDQAAYGGDVVHDTYFAMWQLANSYYEAQIYASGCGNFGSNATLPFAYDVGRCTQGVPQNPSLNGRDTVMLQKKYFGGLHLSEELFKWATTSGASLGDLFISREVLEDRYSSRHSLACDVDTMHHPMQGAIGLRLEEVREVRLERVEVTNLRNLGDRHGPPCMTSFRLLANAEDVVPERSVAEEGGGANARGLHLKISQDIRLKQVSVTDIDSDEGFAIGIDIAPDSNDRSDYGDLRAVKFDGVRVEGLRAARKSMVARLGDDEFNMKDFKSGQPVDNGNWFRPPKLVIRQDINIPGFLPVLGPADALSQFKSQTSYNTDEKARRFLLAGLAQLTNAFGVSFPDGYQTRSLEELLEMQVEPDGVVRFGAVSANYTATAACFGTTCSKPPPGAVTLDFTYAFFVGNSGLTLKGTFGGNAGKFAPPGTPIVGIGVYVFRGFAIDTVNPNAEDIETIFYGECPSGFTNYPTQDGSEGVGYFSCIVENDIFGRGRASGTFIQSFDENGAPTRYVVQNAVFFDDEYPAAPIGSGRITPPVPSDFVPEFQSDIVIFADGVLPVARSRSGADIFPYSFAHHYTHKPGSSSFGAGLLSTRTVRYVSFAATSSSCCVTLSASALCGRMSGMTRLSMLRSIWGGATLWSHMKSTT